MPTNATTSVTTQSTTVPTPRGLLEALVEPPQVSIEFMERGRSATPRFAIDGLSRSVGVPPETLALTADLGWQPVHSLEPGRLVYAGHPDAGGGFTPLQGIEHHNGDVLTLTAGAASRHLARFHPTVGAGCQFAFRKRNRREGDGAAYDAAVLSEPDRSVADAIFDLTLPYRLDRATVLDELTPEDAWLIAFAAGDGAMRHAPQTGTTSQGANSSRAHARLELYQSKPAVIDEIEQRLHSLGLQVSHRDNGAGTRVFELPAGVARRILDRAGLRNGRSLVQLVVLLDADQLLAFNDGLDAAESYRRPTAEGHQAVMAQNYGPVFEAAVTAKSLLGKSLSITDLVSDYHYSTPEPPEGRPPHHHITEVTRNVTPQRLQASATRDVPLVRLQVDAPLILLRQDRMEETASHHSLGRRTFRRRFFSLSMPSEPTAGTLQLPVR